MKLACGEASTKRLSFEMSPSRFERGSVASSDLIFTLINVAFIMNSNFKMTPRLFKRQTLCTRLIKRFFYR